MSLLTWALSPNFAQPDLLDLPNNIGGSQARTNLEKLNETNVLKFNSSIEAFLTAAAPTCENLVLECSLGMDRVMNGSTCCAEFFNPQPVFSRAGSTYLKCL